ncbi:MAG: glutathione S-transferase N-terminal domain-containing protein [Betaproteobacteria bacterium]
MKLYHSPSSPFVRKCLVAAHELGIADRLELVAANAHPVNRDRALVAVNPLGKVPTLVTDDGTILYDSRVICEYLNALGGGEIVPSEPELRWSALALQSLADGVTDAALLTRYETFARPEPLRWTDWIAGQLDKIACGLADLEARASGFGDRVDIGTIAFACSLGYLDFRFASLGWRDRHPNAAAWYEWFSGRESMMLTRPPAA